jgi:mono/diheme cytochrome c family protein
MKGFAMNLRPALMNAMAAALGLAGAALLASEAAALTQLQERGRVLARGLCGGCHATGKTGDSPHLAAPRLRELDRQLDLDKFAQRLREGLLGTHRDMPMFRFTREDASALVAYLRVLQGP